MIDDELAARVLQLYQTDKLSMRQIAAYCGMCAKTVSRVIHSEGVPLRHSDHEMIITPYRRLIEAWYGEHPKLKASQVYERLLGLGFPGSCSTVERATRKLSTLYYKYTNVLLLTTSLFHGIVISYEGGTLCLGKAHIR